MANVRVIVLTASVAFFNNFKEGFRNKIGIDALLNVNTCLDIESKLSRIGENFLIVDLDNTAVSAPILNSFCERYSVTIVLTGVSPSSARPLMTKYVNEFVHKPGFSPSEANMYFNGLYGKILQISGRSVRRFEPQKALDPGAKIVVIASSTGGTEALEVLLRSLSENPNDVPPIVVVQHMPSGFTKLFADRLNNIYPIDIKEAENGEYLQRSQMLIAPAGMHSRLIRTGGRLAVENFVGQKIHGVIPAADVLFDSAAELLRNKAIGVVLTGMGADGARGLMRMHNNGAKTITQDQGSCVVYGMPKAAYELGASDFVLPLSAIGNKILELAR